jgi:hypothetical protein
VAQAEPDRMAKPVSAGRRANPVAFIVAVVLIAWCALYLLRQVGEGQLLDWQALTHSEDFLAGLRTAGSEHTCVALAGMKDLDTVIVGSSHAQRALDMYALQQARPDETFGLCVFPAWDTRTFLIFLDALKQYKSGGVRIIWIADSGSFVGTDWADESRLDRFRSVMGDPMLQSRIRLKWLASSWFSGYALDTGKQAYLQRLEQEQRYVAELDTSVVDRIIAQRDLPDEQRLRRELRYAKVLADNAANLAQLCEVVNADGLTLDVVIYPLPEFARIQPPAGTDWESIQKTGPYIAQHAHCVRQLVDPPREHWALDSRHFLSLDSPLQFQAWQSVEGFSEKFDSLPPGAKQKILDADHLNRAGASVFTQKLTELLL